MTTLAGVPLGDGGAAAAPPVAPPVARTLAPPVASPLGASPPRDDTTGSATQKPYRGPHSYQSEDAHLFYGREEATEQVVAKILSSRFMLLHAQSGAGKTSLLNARVLLALEKRGWMPVRALPQDNPSAAVRFETFRQLLPPPSAEAAAIERALEGLAKPDERVMVRELLARFDRLPKRSDARRRIVAPLEVASYFPLAPADVPLLTLPFFCRLLRSSIDVARFDDHIAAVCGDEFRSANDLCANDLATELSGRHAAASHAALVADLGSPTRLSQFFERWWSVFGAWHNRYAVVLVLDQFEELFTRFADPGPVLRSRVKRTLDWRIREAFFDELRELYESSSPLAAPVVMADDDRLPVATTPRPSLRFVVAIRDEFLAHLDTLRYFLDVDAAKYHLPILHVDEARKAIARPAAEFGYAYADEVFDDILRKLAKEAAFVEPAHLQIVCDRLWQVRGRSLATRERPGDGSLQLVEWEAYAREEMAEGILRNFVADFLGSLTPDQRLEALEMLEALITPAGTRNIVEWSQLVSPPLRDAQLRERLLETMQACTIVRGEWRLGSRFVEITHEFLIFPILRAIRIEIHGDTENARFLDARRALHRVSLTDFRRSTNVLLTPREIDVLLARDGRLTLSLLAAEVLLRSAAVYADEVDPRAAPRVRKCAAEYTRLVAESAANGPSGSHPILPSAPPSGFVNTAEHPLVPSVANAAEVIASLMDSPTQAVRENATRALAFLGGEASLGVMVREALTGPVDRQRIATRELGRLDEPGRLIAAAIACSYLAVPETAASSYGILGKIHASGTEITLPPRAFPDRLRLVGSSVVVDRPKGRTRRWWRVLEPAMPGAVVGSLIALAFVALAMRDFPVAAINAFTLTLGLWLALATPLFVIAATRRSDPIHLHVDQRAAGVIEIWRAFRSTIVSIPVAIALVIAALDDFDPLVPVLVVALMLATVAAVVRGGTLLAYEALSGDVVVNRVAQWMTGGSCGVLLAAVFAYWLGSVDGGSSDARMAMMLWLGLFPACFGLARAFARGEVASPPVRSILGRASAPATIAILTVVLGGLSGLAIAATRRATTGFQVGLGTDVTATKLDSARTPLLVPPGEEQKGEQGRYVVTTLPTMLRLRLSSQGKTEIPLSVVAPRVSPAFSIDLVLELRDSTGRRVDLSDDPPRIDMGLKAGLYYVEVRELRRESNPSEVVSAELWQRLHLTAKPAAAFKPFELFAYILSDSIAAARDESKHLADAGKQAALYGNADSASRYVIAADSTLQAGLPKDTLNPVPADILNSICRAGALAGQASRVLDTCEQVAARESTAYWIVDSRGLARALSGNRAGAIADFQYYMTHIPRNDSLGPWRERRKLRQDWVETLQSGRDLDVARVRDRIRALRSSTAQ